MLDSMSTKAKPMLLIGEVAISEFWTRLLSCLVWLQSRNLLRSGSLRVPRTSVCEVFLSQLTDLNSASPAPYALARTYSSLDHLTKGRIGWNIVTSHSTAAAEAFGKNEVIPHDERYAAAEEYMDIVYS